MECIQHKSLVHWSNLIIRLIKTKRVCRNHKYRVLIIQPAIFRVATPASECLLDLFETTSTRFLPHVYLSGLPNLAQPSLINIIIEAGGDRRWWGLLAMAALPWRVA